MLVVAQSQVTPAASKNRGLFIPDKSRNLVHRPLWDRGLGWPSRMIRTKNRESKYRRQSAPPLTVVPHAVEASEEHKMESL